MKKIVFLLIVWMFFSSSPSQALDETVQQDYKLYRQTIINEFSHKKPRQWSEIVSGVKIWLDTPDKVVALTLDAARTTPGSFDEQLIRFLEKEQIPATIFVSAPWIDKNMDAFKYMASNDLFEIGNHGLFFRPASVNGKTAYDVPGTKNVGELVDEIELNARIIERISGKKPKYYRAGTDYYDEVAVQIAKRLGYEVAGFSILGDMGATYKREEVRNALLNVSAGDIVVLHLDRPEKDSAEGLMEAVPELRKRGYKFVKLSNYRLF